MPPERRVYIVDDDEAVRDSLSAILQARTYAVESFGSAPEFLAAAPSLPLGCLIVDIRMPELDGLELHQRLTGRGLSFPLIVIIDFIEKPFALEAILDSLEVALLRLATPSDQDPTAVATATKLGLLSPREREVLDGLPNKTIGYDLAISPRTVEIHRARVPACGRSLNDWFGSGHRLIKPTPLPPPARIRPKKTSRGRRES